MQEDLCVLAMLTLPYEFQFRWHYWMELPMKPKAPGKMVTLLLGKTGKLFLELIFFRKLQFCSLEKNFVKSS